MLQLHILGRLSQLCNLYTLILHLLLQLVDLWATVYHLYLSVLVVGVIGTHWTFQLDLRFYTFAYDQAVANLILVFI